MHLGLIMDGNGRWASQRSLPRATGHLEGLKACKRIVLASLELGIEYLTLYVFSTENWKRPQQEVSYLMSLLANKLPGELPFFKENNIKIKARGNIDVLPLEAKQGLKQTIFETEKNNGITVILCVNYGGQDEIVRAVNKINSLKINREITTDDIRKNLDCPDVPDVDLIARSAGEMRLSNFMLWDSAYAEFLFIEKLWPDWDKEEIQLCIDTLSKRNRKFGGLAK